MARVAGRLAIAEGYYRSALEINPDHTLSLFGLAVVRSSIPGGVPDTLNLYARLLKLDPNNAIAHYNYGLNLRLAGQVAAGEAELARARQLDASLPVPLRSPRRHRRPACGPRRHRPASARLGDAGRGTLNALQPCAGITTCSSPSSWRGWCCVSSRSPAPDIRAIRLK